MNSVRTGIIAVALLVVGLCLGTGPALAENVITPDSILERNENGYGVSRVFDISMGGHYRLRAVGLADLPIDANGTRSQQEMYGEHRFRVSPWLSLWDSLFLHAQADFFTGQLFGDTTDVGADWVRTPRDSHDGYWDFDPRHLYLEWKAPFGMVKAGQMGSHWGLGILANDGEDRDIRFGDRHHGDIVDRVLIALPPAALFSDADWAKRLVLALGFDVVFRDENADLLDGDFAMQGVGSLGYHAESWSVGAYVAYRSQEDDDGSDLWATAVDLFADWTLPLGEDGNKLRLALEAIITVGHTNRVEPERAPDGMDLLSFGALFRVEAELPNLGLFPRLDIGFASGDEDRTDDVNRAFSFDPDHRVGLILFDQVLPRMSARTADLVYDTSRQAIPPKGSRWMPTNGSVTNAFYLFPSIDYRPVTGLSLRLGLLYALAPASVSGPYESAINGGYPTNYLGGENGGSLGVEIDAGVTYTINVFDVVGAAFGVESAVFFPGDALNGPAVSLDTLWAARGTFDLLW